MILAVNQTIDTARSAIYALVHRDSNRIYVGRTSGTVANRWRQHCNEANKKRAKTYLANSIRKYGAQAFDVVVLEHGIAAVELQAREALYVSALSANVGGIGFNSTAGGEVAPSSDPRVRAKITAAQTGRALTPEWRAKVAAAQRGKRKKPESIEKTAAARRGLTFSQEWRDALSEAHKGHRHSAETRAKMSAAQRARHASRGSAPKYQHGEKMRPIMKALWANPEWRKRTIARMRDAKPAEVRARVYSDETRKKLSAAAKRRWGG
jgi:group I intron endonuclease